MGGAAADAADLAGALCRAGRLAGFSAAAVDEGDRQQPGRGVEEIPGQLGAAPKRASG